MLYLPCVMVINYIFICNDITMKILIVFATNSGSTFLVAKTIESVLQSGNTATVKNADDVHSDDFDTYDFVILGSCTWDHNHMEGQVHSAFLRLKHRLKSKTYEGKQFAVFATGDKTYRLFCAAADHLETMIKSWKGKIVVPALRIDRYYNDEEGNTKQAKEWAKMILTLIS